jgi:hypothetical protein
MSINTIARDMTSNVALSGYLPSGFSDLNKNIVGIESRVLLSNMEENSCDIEI